MSQSALRFIDEEYTTRRQRRINKHHLTPRSRGGKNTVQNLLYIDMEKHAYWHKVFGNKTAEEVLELLTRVVRAKRHQIKNRRRKAA